MALKILHRVRNVNAVVLENQHYRSDKLAMMDRIIGLMKDSLVLSDLLKRVPGCTRGCVLVATASCDIDLAASLQRTTIHPRRLLQEKGWELMAEELASYGEFSDRMCNLGDLECLVDN